MSRLSSEDVQLCYHTFRQDFDQLSIYESGYNSRSPDSRNREKEQKSSLRRANAQAKEEVKERVKDLLLRR